MQPVPKLPLTDCVVLDDEKWEKRPQKAAKPEWYAGEKVTMPSVKGGCEGVERKKLAVSSSCVVLFIVL